MNHSLFSASAAHRWSACPGSIALTYMAPKKSSNYAAAEGTVCHYVGEQCLKNKTHPYGFIGQSFEQDGFTIEFTEELADHVVTYINYVDSINGKVLVEVRSDYRKVLGITTHDAFGTSDAVVLDGSTIHVVDLKMGRVFVPVKGNVQLALYAAGIKESIENLFGDEVEKVVLHIMQPRISVTGAQHELTTHELNEMMAELRSAAEEAVKALTVYDVKKPNSVLQYLNPGEEQCNWCVAKAGCPALKIMAESFDVAAPVQQLSPEDLSQAMAKVDTVAMYIEAIKTEVTRRCSTGMNVPGWKMVLGREGNRKWKDEEEAEKALGDKAVFTRKLLSPAQMEKKLKGVDFSDLIVRSPAKPTLATADDPRQPWVENKDVDNEFDAIV